MNTVKLFHDVFRALSFIILLWWLALRTWGAPTTFPGTVIKVHDGDTIKCTTQLLGTVSIRLLGIDAPELHQEGGIASRDCLRKWCPIGMNVTIQSYGRDRYGRVLGNVSREFGLTLAGAVGKDRLDLSMNQVQLGYAWVYRAYCKDPIMFYAEDQAKIQKLGIWAGMPTPPWEYRKKP